ncbi:hypothetical protein STSP2_00648 [Anaerohalosphaera lusitana]|uniref:DUF1638 domain-containing protein n=1 Tax=Anaerohalosphaera lusitana TaxID=1936003 RepID=A0A1U9NIT0_9BACT|nr:DUF1638 domain-containing protein [Anaerohalosphaera lusitana]AQT67500.1 hypothetical protein STSP2_00648 [Anaerohalosphaera lusitana]
MRLKFIVCKVLQREAYWCAARSHNQVDVVLMPQGLHDTPDKLREELGKELVKTEDVQGRKYDASLLGYGLCSNGVLGLSCEIPLVVPRAHDCITLLLGSKERYQEYFDGRKGIYWYSPGWVESNCQPSKSRYDRTLQEYTDKYGEDNAAYLMEMEQNWMKEYEWATYVGWELTDGEQSYKDYTKEAAEFLGWKYDELIGKSLLVQKLVDGDWDKDKFLTVQPGQKVGEDLTSDGIIRAEDNQN